MDENDLSERAQLILDRINGVFAENGMSLPTRQYITVGETVHDCEQVTVALQNVQLGIPSGNGMTAVVCNSTLPTSATYNVEIVRCIPTTSGGRNSAPKPPRAEALDENGSSQMTDARLLLQAGYDIIESTWSREGSADVGIGPASGEYQAVTLAINTVI